MAKRSSTRNKPTVLVYGHYDVQPPDPLELWHSGPFDPVIKDGKIYARGSADDKGQFYMHVKAFETMVRTRYPAHQYQIHHRRRRRDRQSQPGANLSAAHKDLLKADVILISDTAMLSLDTPSIDIGVRGLSLYRSGSDRPQPRPAQRRIWRRGANPITILAKMIASCHDANNHITIPGFYDDVVEATPGRKKADGQGAL